MIVTTTAVAIAQKTLAVVSQLLMQVVDVSQRMLVAVVIQVTSAESVITLLASTAAVTKQLTLVAVVSQQLMLVAVVILVVVLTRSNKSYDLLSLKAVRQLLGRLFYVGLSPLSPVCSEREVLAMNGMNRLGSDRLVAPIFHDIDFTPTGPIRSVSK